jgi:dihydroxy-acid dehydratase
MVGDWLRTTPIVARVKPAGPASLGDLERAGGIPASLEALGDLVDRSAISGLGVPWAELLATHEPNGDAVDCGPDREEGAIVVLRGTLAPNGAVLKRAAANRALWKHTGPAVVFNGVKDLHARINDPSLGITPDSVLVLINTGPVGGPGMPEVGQLPIPVALLKAGVTDMVRITDARMSGTASGCCILHVSPEAAVGGPLSRVRDGDVIHLDAEAGVLDVLVDPEQFESRVPAKPQHEAPSRGYGGLYSERVTQAERGLDLDFLIGNEWSTP